MNRLAAEKSPYLLQHAGNPVDWFPWSDDAFEKAVKEDKPVFLSIGYATCHWCHVMEHESFEDDDVARLMNDTFVNIKVDREERPDIDHTYMTVCQMLSGSGGWPLTIIMTPDKKPFYAATYIPKKSFQNRIGMLDLVPALAKAWQEDRARVMSSVKKIEQGFQKTLELGQSSGPLPDSITDQTAAALSGSYDDIHGGFGGAPKFPSAHNLIFLMNLCRQAGKDNLLPMVEKTLTKMRLGGLWDHIGNGFHRYSTDREWLLPHFEKMLYDQAMLLLAYAEGATLTGNELFRQTARDIVSYTADCLTSPEGAFYSAEDADSEGEEGKFYVWTTDEIETVLSDDEAGFFISAFNLNTEGNFLDEATRQRTGANIPHLSGPLSGEKRELASAILEKLRKHRNTRVRPLLDDKILTDWNGLMIGALARSGSLLECPEWIQRAERAWKQIETRCLTDDITLLHRYRDGEAGIDGMADDYAFSIFGLTELYLSTQNSRYLEQALNLQKTFDDRFFDNTHGGYYFTASGSDILLGRQKEIYDGAIPSSNSVAVLNGFRLSRLTGNPDLEVRARSVFESFSESVADAPAGYTFAMNALLLMNNKANEIIITAEKPTEQVRQALDLCRHHSPAGSVWLLKTPENAEHLRQLSEFSAHYPVQEPFAAYVCSGFSCKAPVYSLEELKKILC